MLAANLILGCDGFIGLTVKSVLEQRQNLRNKHL